MLLGIFQIVCLLYSFSFVKGSSCMFNGMAETELDVITGPPLHLKNLFIIFLSAIIVMWKSSLDKDDNLQFHVGIHHVCRRRTYIHHMDIA